MLNIEATGVRIDPYRPVPTRTKPYQRIGTETPDRGYGPLIEAKNGLLLESWLVIYIKRMETVLK